MSSKHANHRCGRRAVERARSCSQLSALALAASSWGAVVAAPLPYLPATGEIRVNDFTLGKQVPFSIANTPGGEFVVGWNSRGQDGDAEGIFTRRYDASGRPLTAEIPVTITTLGVQFHSTVATDAQGNFVVAWNQISTVNGDIDMFYRLFNAAGQALSGELPLNTTTAGTQIVFGASMAPGGRFALTWTSASQDGSSYGTYARVFAPGGAPLSGEIPVNLTTTGRQQPAPGGVAMEPDGQFVVAWESVNGDGDDLGVFARRFDAGGNPLTGEIAVNTTTVGRQRPGGVATNQDGDFVVAWRSEGQDGDDYGIYARVFQASGAALTPELAVNSYTTGFQRTNGVAMDANGDFVVVWRSDGQDGDDLSARARRYTREGQPLGGEIALNLYTTRGQFPVGVAMDADGDFTTVWASGGQDGSDSGVFLRRYTGAEDVDLSLTQTGPGGRIRVGAAFQLVLGAHSLHPSAVRTGIPDIDGAIGRADVVKLASTPPAGAQFQSATGQGWSCSPSPMLVNCVYAPSLAPGASAPELALNFLAGSSTGALPYGAALDAAQFDSRQNNNLAGGTLTVCDGGTLQFSKPGYRRNEDGGTVTVAVVRTGTVCGPASVQFQTANGSAVAGQDYVAASGSLNWGDRQTGVRTFEVNLLNDALDEVVESLRLDLSAAVNAVIGPQAPALLEIADDDAPPLLRAGTDFSVSEGASGVAFRLSLDAPSGRDVVARLALGGTATRGQDYGYNSGLTVTIPAGASAVDIPLNNTGSRIVDDSAAEPTETISLTVTSAVGASVARSTQTVLIVDND